MRLDNITLEGMLPRVFVSESIPDSGIWRATATFRRGESYLVEATSGGGKSSMCAYIYGARTDFEGRLLFNGVDTSRFDMTRWQQLRRENIAYLPQDLMLFPELTALENIRLKKRPDGLRFRQQDRGMARTPRHSLTQRLAGRTPVCRPATARGNNQEPVPAL